MRNQTIKSKKKINRVSYTKFQDSKTNKSTNIYAKYSKKLLEGLEVCNGHYGKCFGWIKEILAELNEDGKSG
ncbi:hypothetical protein AAEO57_13370 [Flavobacterium sp. DGU38]|uniref:Uncharacterized protein n=1 Tax=Flavobacterium calami TaxID=3139144 RepID=A0ABU9IQP2_9FLAO